jgi:hypothetical protein
MNEPTPDDEPEQHGISPGHEPLPRPPTHVPARRRLGAPAGAQPAPSGPPEAGAPATDGPADAHPRPDAPDASDPAPVGRELGHDDPQPLGLRVEETGHPAVDAQLRRLEDADHLAVSGHLEVYEDVHRGLRDTLTALDRHDPRS